MGAMIPTDLAAEAAPGKAPAKYGIARKVAAWAVHLYTALGLPLALFSFVALNHGFTQFCFLFLCAACFIDATDGALARLVRVKEVLPGFDGGRLDDIVDFLNFVFVPMMVLDSQGLLSEEWEYVVLVPLMASGYGFSQASAKTDDSFVGFPSYWNVVVLYLWLLRPPDSVSLSILLSLSVLIFVPIHFVYPSRTLFLRPVTIVLGSVWSATLVGLCLWPFETWSRNVALVSLLYPAYYFVISFIHHLRVKSQLAADAA